jgi:hypothetical protein
VPPFKPPGAVLLDVTLRRAGLVRRWTIHTGDLPNYWACRLVSPNAVTVSACFTEAEAWARVQEWGAEIDAAKADGWN